jgi:hypothetical protein
MKETKAQNGRYRRRDRVRGTRGRREIKDGKRETDDDAGRVKGRKKKVRQRWRGSV